MLRRAIIALCLCLGIGLIAAPSARAAPPIADGVAAAAPAPTVEKARWYRVYYRRRYYRPRYYRRYYYRPRYYRRRYYRFY